MTVFYVKAIINDRDTGVCVEKLDFFYRTKTDYARATDLTDEDREKLYRGIDKLREYEVREEDVYRVDAVLLQDKEAEEDDEEPEHYTDLAMTELDDEEDEGEE